MSDKKAVYSQRQYTGFDASQALHATFAQFDARLSTMSVDNLAVFVIFSLAYSCDPFSLIHNRG